MNFSKTDDLMQVHGRYHELSEDQIMDLKRRDQAYMSRTSMPSNPKDPFYYHVYSHTLPKEHFYRMVPEGKLNQYF